MSVPSSRRGFLAAAAASALLAPPALARDPSPDAALLALCDRLLAAWAVEIPLGISYGDGFDAAFEASSGIVGQIEALPATTAAGLGVKALAVCWCESGSLEVDFAFADYRSTDLRLLAEIRREVLMLGGGRPVPAAPVPATLAAADPDAALLAYEPRLRALKAEMDAKFAEAERIEAAFEATVPPRPEWGDPASAAWGERWHAAKEASGYDAAYATFEWAVVDFNDVRDEIAEIQASTLAGLRLKARYSEEYEPLAESILADLRAIDAEALS